MTSCIYYWCLPGKYIIDISQILRFMLILDQCFLKIYIFLWFSFIEILPKNKNESVAISRKASLYMTMSFLHHWNKFCREKSCDAMSVPVPGHFAPITCSPTVVSPRKMSRFTPLNRYYIIIDVFRQLFIY